MLAHSRIAMAWLLSLSLAVTFCSPIFAQGRGGGGGHGGGGGGGGGGHSGGGGGGWSGGGGGGGGGGVSHTGSGLNARSGGDFHSGSHVDAGSRSFSHSGPGSFDAHNMNHNGSWNHNWAGYPGGWGYDHMGWHHYGPGWNPWWGVGFWWPSWGLSVGLGGPYYYDYYGADYYEVPYMVSSPAYEAVPYTANYGPTEAEAAATTAAPPQTGGETSDFYAQGTEAFLQGEYQAATRLAAHASIDDPRNPSVHLLMSLGLFAVGEYRGAAMESHAVVALGKTPDWPALFGFYGNVKPYTEHLRALEKYVRENPKAPEGRFLLGFHYMMGGHKDTAKDEFLQALKLTPKDRLAAQLLTQVGGTVPADIAAQLSQLPPPKASAPPSAPEPDKSVPPPPAQ